MNNCQAMSNGWRWLRHSILKATVQRPSQSCPFSGMDRSLIAGASWRSHLAQPESNHQATTWRDMSDFTRFNRRKHAKSARMLPR